MLSAGTLLRAPAQSWTVTMKPTGHCRKAQAKGPIDITVQAIDKPEAIRLARLRANEGGMSGFAITDVQEVVHERNQQRSDA